MQPNPEFTTETTESPKSPKTSETNKVEKLKKSNCSDLLISLYEATSRSSVTQYWPIMIASWLIRAFPVTMVTACLTRLPICGVQALSCKSQTPNNEQKRGLYLFLHYIFTESWLNPIRTPSWFQNNCLNSVLHIVYHHTGHVFTLYPPQWSALKL